MPAFPPLHPRPAAAAILLAACSPDHSGDALAERPAARRATR